jgi:hypothetical protein
VDRIQVTAPRDGLDTGVGIFPASLTPRTRFGATALLKNEMITPWNDVFRGEGFPAFLLPKSCDALLPCQLVWNGVDLRKLVAEVA